jgi:hypothetical protein
VPGDAIVAGPVPATTDTAPPLGALRQRAVDRRGLDGTLLWSQLYDDAWSARSSTGSLDHEHAFGWSNAFPAAGNGPVDVTFTDQWWRWPILALQLVIVGLVARRILQRGRRRRGRRGAGGGEVGPAPEATDAAEVPEAVLP